MRACNHSSQEIEARAYGHSLLSTKFEASLWYLKRCLKWDGLGVKEEEKQEGEGIQGGMI